ncbi:hypothetical protein FOCC_FOCC005627 [Frankliniella occidentalis]|nr:hypothetical protein FOCC_FOCC005627 [Frankliniella occidentalis]
MADKRDQEERARREGWGRLRVRVRRHPPRQVPLLVRHHHAGAERPGRRPHRHPEPALPKGVVPDPRVADPRRARHLRHHQDPQPAAAPAPATAHARRPRRHGAGGLLAARLRVVRVRRPHEAGLHAQPAHRSVPAPAFSALQRRTGVRFDLKGSPLYNRRRASLLLITLSAMF